MQDLLLISDLQKENKMAHVVTSGEENDIGCFTVGVEAFTSVLTEVADEQTLS